MRTGEDVPSPSTVLTKKDFGRVLTSTREVAGLTVRDLARKTDVPSGTVSGWCTGRHLPTLSQKDLFLRLLTTCGVTEESRVEEWLTCWLRLRRPLGQPRTDAPTPYRGLEPFQTEHAKWFFGRSRLTETLARRVASASPGLVITVGSSGSGKSSLLRAGLLPALCENNITGTGRRWQGLLLTPGPHPMSALAAELTLLEDVTADTIETELRGNSANAVQRLRQLVERPLLIVVDQFEELFTACADPTEQAAFLDVLHELSDPADDPLRALRVVVGMRADFYPDALRWPLLASALQDNQFVVGPMTEDELRQAIIEPARRAGMRVEDGLIDVLLRDLAPAGAAHGTGDTGALPLLSHALLATWEQGQHQTMSIKDYQATGGIHGAIAQTAETVYTQLGQTEQALVRQLFLRLVHVGDDTPDTRRRVQLDELTGGLDNDRYAQIQKVLGWYVDRRLITADIDGVEISHEALLDAWPRLREWIDTDRSGHRLHRQLTEAARSWHQAEHDPEALYRGVRLDATVDWVTTQDHRSELNQLEQQFVDASVRANRAERLRERSRTRRLRWLAAALGALLVLSVGATTYSVQQRETADHERNLAISRQVAGTANRVADSDPALAAQLAVAAYRIAPTVEATSSLLAASGRPTVTRMVRPGNARQAIAVNPAGTLLAAAGATDTDTAILLWDLRHPGRPTLLSTRLTGHTSQIYSVAFSPDGTTLATGSGDKTVRLWNLADITRPTPIGQPLTGPQDRVLAVEFSPDGSTLAAGGRDTTLRFWDVRDRSHPVTIPAVAKATGDVQSIAFTPAGNTVAIADAGGAVSVWDVGNREHPRPLGQPLSLPSRVNTVAFSPDGTTLAAGSNDFTVRLWTMTDPARPTPAGVLTGATGWINAITFSANGKLLAAANASARVQLWDLTTHQMRLDLPHTQPATAVAFRDNDRVLYTTSADGIARRWLIPGPVLPTANRQITALTIDPHHPLLVDSGNDLQLWDLTDRDHPLPLGPPLTAPTSSDRLTGTVAESPDAHTLAAASRADNTILLWDITTPDHPRQHPAPLTGHTKLVEDITFGHQGQLLVTTSDDSTVRLWNTTDTKPLATLNSPFGFVYAAALSSNDQILAAVTQRGYLALWNIRDPRHPTPLGTPIRLAQEDARSVAISPDNHTLAIGIANGTVQLWDIDNPSTPTPIEQPITGLEGIVHSLAFNPNGSILAGGDSAGQTWMWNITDLHHPTPLAVLHPSTTATWALRFSSDGQTLTAASGDIHLWDTDPNHSIQRICDNTGDKITEPEWTKNIPDTSYQPICP